jgi:hypothetical protein
MNHWTSFVVKLPRILRVATGGIILAVQACAPSHPFGNGREPTMADWAKVEDDVRRYKIEREKFDKSHPLVGRMAEAVAQELSADGYVCEIGHMDLPKPPKGDGRGYFVRTPLLFCESKSSTHDDFCAERHVVLDVAWPDTNVGLPELQGQMGEVAVTQRTFRCETPNDVAIRLRRRQQGRQE